MGSGQARLAAPRHTVTIDAPTEHGGLSGRWRRLSQTSPADGMEDMFFPPRDCAAEEALIPDSQMRVVDTIAQHLGLLGPEPAYSRSTHTWAELIALEPYTACGAAAAGKRRIHRRPAPTFPRP